MEIQSTNFSFLREHDPKLVDLAASAEQFFHIHINTCISTLGKFAEQLAKIIAANRGLSKVPNEGQLELLRRLEVEGIIPSEIADLFHNIRKERNRVVHDKYKADSRKARTLIEDARELGIWFHRTFNDRNFKPVPFVPPAAPITADDKLKSEIERLQRLVNEKEADKGVIAAMQAEIKSLQALVAKVGKKPKKRIVKTARKTAKKVAEPAPIVSPKTPTDIPEIPSIVIPKPPVDVAKPAPIVIPKPPVDVDVPERPPIVTLEPPKSVPPITSPERSKKSGWHHGVIGIVASRLVERYGAPVFIGSYEDAHDDDSDQVATVRFSVRGIPEFHVFNALEYEPIKTIRNKGGGHKAAGGFTLPAENLEKLRDGLREFADRENILPSHISPLINIDVRVDLSDISMTLLQECDRLQPCGLGNPDPVFYSENVRVLSQQTRGKDKVKHLSLELDTGNGKIKAIAWRWGEYCPVPDHIDIAYKLRANQWQDTTSVELEIVGIREAGNLMEDATSSPKQIQLQYKPAPLISKVPQWQKLSEAPRPLPRPLLLYGCDRPADKFQGDVDCDRPKRDRNYEAVVLWTLPPSFTHLQWLIATAQPDYIYLGSHIPSVPSIEQFRAQVQSLDLENIEKLNLLDISQQWWISPSAIIAALRERGYLCDFPNTLPLEGELLRMQKWYSIAINKLAKILADQQ